MTHVDWLDIKDAPKDGTRIIVCEMPVRYLFEPIVVSWRGYHSNMQGKMCWRTDNGNKVDKPTHFIPMLTQPTL